MQPPQKQKRSHHSEICVLCGKNVATTRDHLPPEGIFHKPLPSKSNLITVPACAECNNGSSLTDEDFQAFLALSVGHRTPSGTTFFQQKGRATVLANRSRFEAIRSQMSSIDVVDPNGQYLGRAPTIRWDGRVFETLILRLIRGLYWHHTRTILPQDSNIEIQWPKAMPTEAIKLVREMQCEHAGIRTIGDQFAYCFMVLPENNGHSLWIFEFHQCFLATGFTMPPGYVLAP